jgi:gamma-glutamylcysteine synthetase
MATSGFKNRDIHTQKMAGSQINLDEKTESEMARAWGWGWG